MNRPPGETQPFIILFKLTQSVKLVKFLSIIGRKSFEGLQSTKVFHFYNVSIVVQEVPNLLTIILIQSLKDRSLWKHLYIFIVLHGLISNSENILYVCLITFLSKYTFCNSVNTTSSSTKIKIYLRSWQTYQLRTFN